MNELLLLAYLLLFGVIVLGLHQWKQRQRKQRLPFADDLKLLRAPGETQRELVQSLDEKAVFWMLGAALVPVLTGYLLLRFALNLPESMQAAGVAIAVLTSGVILYFAARWFAGRMLEISNRYLGSFGERVVAEYLEPLKARGARVFHDVPAAAGGKEFNLDHVVVALQGVAVIETKTRRKSTNARPGFEGHKVFFDGHELVWPWGEDSHGLAQAERSAGWLADMLLAETGQRVPVTPILALPGWWVEMKPASNPRACRVTNPNNLPQLLGTGAPVLTAEQVVAITARLEARCRTVAY